jgi:hypothetical protein
MVQQVVRNKGAMGVAKMSPDRDAIIWRDVHLPERGRIFLSPVPDSLIFRQKSVAGHSEGKNAVHS